MDSEKELKVTNSDIDTCAADKEDRPSAWAVLKGDLEPKEIQTSVSWLMYGCKIHSDTYCLLQIDTDC